MSGSIDYAGYTDDAANTFAVRVDKSNSFATCAGVPLMIAKAQSGSQSRPYRFRLRYVLAYNVANPIQRRKFDVGNPSAVLKVKINGSQIITEDYPGPGDIAGIAQTWNVTFYSGEKSAIAAFAGTLDTGLTV